MRLFIAEKPSLAKAIFEGLGGNSDTEKKGGYFQRGSDVVTWCVGHMEKAVLCAGITLLRPVGKENDQR